ncbi:MAG TPA: serine hydrolase, partial [Myxococcales bacterium]|nr:serine hydrolase [Myxococcales bacterium]
NGDTPMPQQSTFKAWLAVAAADAVERGEASWEDEVRIERAHLLFPYQPIAEEVGPEGSAFTLAHLVEQVLLVSDNPSADAILRHLGGTEAVQAALERRGVEGVRITTNEEGLHALA